MRNCFAAGVVGSLAKCCLTFYLDVVIPHLHWAGSPTLVSGLRPIACLVIGMTMSTQRRKPSSVSEEEINFLQSQIRRLGVEEVDDLPA